MNYVAYGMAIGLILNGAAYASGRKAPENQNQQATTPSTYNSAENQGASGSAVPGHDASMSGAANTQTGAEGSNAAVSPSGAGSMDSSMGAADASATGRQLSGTIQSVENKSKRIQVRDLSGNLTELSLGTNVAITRGGQTAALTDLKPGDQVTVDYSRDSMTVQKIAVQ